MATDKELGKLEDLLAETDDNPESPPSDIVAFNELRSSADLLRLYKSGNLDLTPDFQRDVVWENPDQTRFIDSLTKQLPIPSMCISLDYKTDERVVIDGLQRIKSIVKFLSDEEWQLSDLEDIDPRLSGKTNLQVKSQHQQLYDRVQNIMIPITVMRCDYSAPLHMEYLFTIFHRLNSGGMKLTNQEIRNCIFSGTFNTAIKDLSNEEAIISVIGKIKRFGTQEYILRFFAFYDNYKNYSGKLSKFLNDYMNSNRSIAPNKLEKMKSALLGSAFILSQHVEAKKPLANSLGKTYVEGLLFGIAQNLDTVKQMKDSEISSKIELFKNLPEFSAESLSEGLSSKKNVQSRLEAARNHFKD